MKLSKDQIRIIKSEAIFVCALIVVHPLTLLLFGKQMSWNDFFLFAGATIVVGLLVGIIITVGANVPTKKD